MRKTRRVKGRTLPEDPAFCLVHYERVTGQNGPVATFNPGGPGEYLVLFTHVYATDKIQVPMSGAGTE